MGPTSQFAPPAYGAQSGAATPTKPREPLGVRLMNHNGAISKALENLFQVSNRLTGSDASQGATATPGPPSVEASLDAQENLIGQLVNLADHLSARI